MKKLQTCEKYIWVFTKRSRDITFVECGLLNNRYSRLTILGITVNRLIVPRVRAAGVNDVHKAHKEHQ